MDISQVLAQLQEHPEIVGRLADSQDGKALMARLDSAKLEAATQQGQQGNYAEMAKLLKEVMRMPDGKALLQRMAQQMQK